jgi:kynurenine formamidase
VSALVDALRAARIVDASPTLETGMPVFPGHPPVVLNGSARIHERDGYFLQTVFTGEHAGSHVDAPAHALADRQGATIDTFPVERFVVPYVIVDLAPLGLGAGDLATAADVTAAIDRTGASSEPGDAVLLHYGWDRHRDRADGWWAANAPGLDEAACRLIADLRPGLVGSDTATCDTAVASGEIIADHGHTTFFLPNDILLVEGLLGLGEAPRRGVFVGVPLRIAGGSASPIRAVLIAEPDA